MRRPLDARRIVVTRPGAAGAELALMLEGLGADVRHRPAFEIAALAPPADLASVLASATDLLLTSKAGLEALIATGLAIGPHLIAHCAGNSTASAVRAAGHAVGIVSAKGGLEDLVAGLLATGGLEGRRFLWPASALSDPEPSVPLVAAGASLQVLPLYEPRALLRPEDMTDLVDFEIFVFASPSAISALEAASDPSRLARLHDEARALAIGATTAQALKRAGWRRIDVAARPDNEGLLAACLEHYGA